MKQFTLCAFADEAGSSVSEQIAALSDNGIPLLELRGVNGRNVTALSVSEMRALNKELHAAGISVWSIGSPIGKIALSDPWDAHVSLFQHTLALADACEAKNMRIFSFYLDPAVAEREKEEILDRLGTMAELARPYGVTLCHENEKGIFGDTPERCVMLHKEIPAIRSVFDPANFVQCGCDTQKAWSLLSPYVDYMHIKDVAQNGEIVPAGEGIARIPELLSQYHGSVLTLEPHLAEFVGLASLEQSGETSQIGARYASTRDAFDHAVCALKALLSSSNT